MSWDGYIDNLMAQSTDASGTMHAAKAAIIGLDDGTPWTSNIHPNALHITPQEGKRISEAFKRKDYQDFISNGVVLEGRHYMFLREVDKHIVYAKLKAGEGSPSTISMFASQKAVVIGLATEQSQAGMLNQAVAVIGEYMESQSM